MLGRARTPSNSSLESTLSDSPAVTLARAALAGRDDAWIVGGAVRDALLCRPLLDLDLAVPRGEEEGAGRAIAKAGEGHAFELSGEFATWRVELGQPWRVDVTGLRAASIEDDLAARDFTVNAIAVPLAGGEPLDPTGGARDLEARMIRAAGPRSFLDDPLRLLRAARIAAELAFEIDPDTVSLASADAGRAAEPAGERQFAELHGIVAGPDPLRGLALMDELTITAVVLPELEGLRGVEQNPYHHLDVHGHTLAVLERALELEREPGSVLGERADAVRAHLQEPLADELSRAGALRFAALLHDIGKPAVRTVNDEGRIFFLGHDEVGARMVGELCTRLRTSRELRRHLELLTRHHLRLGFLVHSRPLSRRQVYDYLTATEPAAADVTLLTVADRLATQGPRTKDEAIDAHLELAREMLGEAFAWRGRPAPPIRGDELAAELGIDEGPELGRLMEELSAATFEGEVTTRDRAVELARLWAADLD